MERSAVFTVQMIQRFSGKEKVSPEYCNVTLSPRYSSRKYSSPITLVRFARLTSSMTKTYFVSGSLAALRARSFSGPSTRAKPDCAWSVALDEVLVGVRGMELDEER